MRSLFRLAIAGLFLAGDVSASASSQQETTIAAPSIDAPSHELHYVDRDIQSRRKEWDMFSFLMMALQGCPDVLPHHCPKRASCMNGDSAACQHLCDKKDGLLEKHHSYGQFCNYSSSSTANTNAANTDVYNGNSTPEGVVAGGNYAMGFQFWMVAVAVSVGMALVAVHMGQRREDLEDEDKSLLGAEVRGSVGRRVGVVSGLMDGVLGEKTTTSSKQVEMAEYQLEPSNSYESAMV